LVTSAFAGGFLVVRTLQVNMFLANTIMAGGLLALVAAAL
jgi:hypothetical protein